MHTIRLRGPWQKRASGRSDWSRVQVPESSDIREVADAVCIYRRSFNRPTGIGPGTHVHLLVHGCQGHLRSVSVNERAIACEKDHADAEITELLKLQNQVEIVLEATAEHEPRLSGEVSLKIEESANNIPKG